MQSGNDLPDEIKTNAQTALYHNLSEDEALALQVDQAVKKVKKSDWRGNSPKENEIKHALFEILNYQSEVERIFSIVKQQSEH